MIYEIYPYEMQPLVFEPADPHIPDVFAYLCQFLQEQMDNIQLEHVGSTAIAEMPGKNSLNLQLLVSRARFEEVLATLTQLGFGEHPYITDTEHPVRVGRVHHQDKPYSVHILITEPGSQYHQNALFFRDYLREHPEAKEAYAELKRSIIESGGDHAAYRQAKNQFIAAILQKRLIL